MKYKEGEGEDRRVSLAHISQAVRAMGRITGGLNWIITYNMIDSKLNTFYDHSDGKICIVVYLFDQK